MHDTCPVLLQTRYPEARGIHEHFQPFVSHELVITGSLRVLINRIGNVRVLMPHVITDTPGRLFSPILRISHPREASARGLQTSRVATRSLQCAIAEAQ